MGFAGLMRLEAEAKNSSENERMRDVKCAEIRSIRDCQQCFQAAGMLGTIDQGLAKRWSPGAGDEGFLPMHVAPKVLSI